MAENLTARMESTVPISRADADAFGKMMADRQLLKSDQTVKDLLAGGNKEIAYFQVDGRDTVMGKTGLMLAKYSKALPINAELDYPAVKVWTQGEKNIIVFVEKDLSFDKTPSDADPRNFFPVGETLVVHEEDSRDRQKSLRQPRFNPEQMKYREGVLVDKEDLVYAGEKVFVKSTAPVHYVDEEDLGKVYIGEDDVVVVKVRKGVKVPNRKPYLKDFLRATMVDDSGEEVTFIVDGVLEAPSRKS